MKKKILYVVALVALAALCLGLLVSCNNSTANFFEYSEKDIGLIGRLVALMHGWIGNYGWTVVVFTVFLMILTMPLEFWQRYSSRKSTLKMQRIQPLLEAIDKRYGANTQRANEEKQKLYKKQGYSMASMCLPMIVTLVIFFLMFGGLRNYSSYSSIKLFRELSEVYHETYVEQILDNDDIKSQILSNEKYNEHYAQYQDALEAQDAKSLLNAQTNLIDDARKVDAQACNTYQDGALEAVKSYYEEHHESWLWIQNVWQPDTWAPIMQPYNGNTFLGGSFENSINMDGYPGSHKEIYNLIRNAVLETGGYGNNGTWNGLMIMPVLSIGLSFLSMFISQRQEKKNRKGEAVQLNQQQAATNKTMLIVMPLMMAYFGFIYTGAFAIYMVVSSTIRIFSTLAMRIPVEKAVLKKLDKDEDKNKSSKASYMR